VRMADHRIYVEPVGDQDVTVLDRVAEEIEAAFDLPVLKLKSLRLPEYALNASRGQYHSTKILRALLSHVPHDALRMLGVTDVDLFVPRLNFVFGEAALDGRVAVISLYRLRPEFYGEPPDEDIFLRRAVKEAIHELGHTFGLKHCPNPKCVMYFSNNIKDTDRKAARFHGEDAERLSRKLEAVRAAA